MIYKIDKFINLVYIIYKQYYVKYCYSDMNNISSFFNINLISSQL